MPKRFFSDFEDKDKVNSWSDKNELKPHQVKISSMKIIKFNCNKCPHEFDRRINDLTNDGCWCPFCANKKLCGQESCTYCFEKSFASYDEDKVKYWSDKNILKPIEVFKSSNKKFIFNCNKCPHEFENDLNHVTHEGNWCPFCANKKLCGQESCTYCYEKSFASFDDKHKLKCWSDKNTLKPLEVFKSTHKKIIFNCNKCPHEFESRIYSVTSGRWCPFCVNKKLCGQESCTYCFEKSFASFDAKNKVKCWSDKNTLKTLEIFKGSGTKSIFNCNKCSHEFESMTKSVKDGTWCPFCNASKNKFIRKLFEIFDKMNMKYNVEVSVKCEGRNLRWDMIVYNNEREFYIESDGEQHFSVKGLVFTHVNIPNEEEERKFKDQRDRDLLKEKHIIDNNKLLFRISYRQFDQLEELVQEMISKSDENHKGVVKMDDIYW